MILAIIVMMLEATLLATLRTRTALTTLWTGTTLATFWTGTALTLYEAFWFRKEHTTGKLVLASLGINLKEFHLNLVTLFDASLFHCLKTLPVNL